MNGIRGKIQCIFKKLTLAFQQMQRFMIVCQKKIASFSEAFESHNAEREVNGLIPLINKYLPAALLDTRMHGSAMYMTAQLP